MTIKVGSSSSWKTMTNMKVGVGGSWKQVQKIMVGVGGAWKTAWTYLTVSVFSPISDFDSSTQPADASASLTVNSSGALTTSPDGTGNQTWLVAGSASQVDVRLSQTGLTGNGVMGGAALATWLNCSTTRTWTITNTTNGFNPSTFTGTLEFRDATTLAVLDTATVSLTANTEL
jgi:hypothetical protein